MGSLGLMQKTPQFLNAAVPGNQDLAASRRGLAWGLGVKLTSPSNGQPPKRKSKRLND